MNKSIFILIVIFAAIAVVSLFLFTSSQTMPSPFPTPTQTPTQEITSFEECVEAGNPVMESFPRQCRVNGQTFTEDIGNTLEKEDTIRIDMPRPNEVVESPLEISGEARGTWYFEAQFPVRLENTEGKLIAEGIAQAQDDWMTEGFVPYEATITFQESEAEEGTLVLEKANPSGLPENEEELRVPVRFELLQ
ncbi:MAG: Gmad2 immunoglobulin-like domain-containing protein [Patescibacteria group bacterium]|jgi:hypothetical protein